MQISLDRSHPQPIYLQLAHEIQRRIRAGALPAGARLPTVRELAGQLGVTRLTVHSAYSELQSGGWVEATVGRGTFVAQRAEALDPFVPGERPDTHRMIADMQRLARLPGMRSLAMADAAVEFHPTREVQRAVEEALRDAGALSYTSALGEPLLRTVLVDLVARRGVRTSPDEILVTGGVTQGLALLTRALAQPGDTALVESPTYLGALNVLGAQGVRAVPVPMDAEGPDLTALAALASAHRPRFFYTIPTFHNPLGISISPARRSALLTLAEQHGFWIVEDDIYGELALDGPPPLALRAEAGAERVVYLSSLSKCLLPGLRVGYVVAPQALLPPLITLKQADDLCSPALTQRAAAILIERGWMSAHLRRILPRYRERRDALLEAMTRFFPSELRWSVPTGGLSTWVTLPPGSAVTDLYLAAIERGVAFTPGDLFFSGPAPVAAIRLSFSALPPDQLHEAARVLGQVLGGLTLRSTTRPRVSVDWVPIV